MNGSPLKETPFAAVLLAGGRSQRMGRDKALLRLPDGQPLWRCQLSALEALAPAELFISGFERAEFPRHVRRLDDAVSGLGPLAGLTAALRAMRSPLLVVLAVDLPAMTADYLRGLLALSRTGCGAVPRHGDFYEPLAAVYPAECLPLVEERLHGADRSMQGWIRAALAAGLVRTVEVGEADAPLFLNWNSPDDLLGQPSQSFQRPT
jgi:molybdopterin-guanine dinucleotide biosynthesis protein A